MFKPSHWYEHSEFRQYLISVSDKKKERKKVKKKEIGNGSTNSMQACAYSPHAEVFLC